MKTHLYNFDPYTPYRTWCGLHHSNEIITTDDPTKVTCYRCMGRKWIGGLDHYEVKEPWDFEQYKRQSIAGHKAALEREEDLRPWREYFGPLIYQSDEYTYENVCGIPIEEY